MMITVIIPSYNSEKTIRNCLDSVQNQKYINSYEIILVDSSTDKTPQIVNRFYPNVKLIHLDKKTDPGRARNIGIEKANGSLIAFIDSDCIANFDWLEKINERHNKGYDIVGGAVINGNSYDDIIAWAGYIAEFRDFFPEQPGRTVNHIPTCNISYKKSIFKKYGFFNGNFYPQEDLVYNHNLFLKGEKILFDPDILVRHFHRTRLKDFLLHQRRIGTITSRVLKKIDLDGSAIVRNPALAVCISPFLFSVKFIRTYRIIKHLNVNIPKRNKVLITFALGLIFWNIGFGLGIFEI